MSPFIQLAAAFRLKIQPSLVAIYADHPHSPDIVSQVGTGYLVRHRDRPVVITAKHTLYGESGTEDPGEKSFFWDGKLHYINSVPRQIFQEPYFDVASFFADELATKPQLPVGIVALPKTPIPLVTIAGYLARDFRRSGSTLKPAVRIHTDSRMGASKGQGFVAVRYTRRRNKSSFTGNRLEAVPQPSGLSGGPMLDTFSLLSPDPKIIGTFTDLKNGEAFGANSLVAQKLLSAM
ncbi:hypothetical protein [Neorhizobium sp. T6_25]|uniref:hypothetical protein n=1 Tax=Neorhizobium sp. T6_25 TaxID=2093833 RepID=UPI000CF98DA9|nr:hypothetical protein [Neorhizobium sp. T6_25]